MQYGCTIPPRSGAAEMVICAASAETAEQPAATAAGELHERLIELRLAACFEGLNRLQLEQARDAARELLDSLDAELRRRAHSSEDVDMSEAETVAVL